MKSTFFCFVLFCFACGQNQDQATGGYLLSSPLSDPSDELNNGSIKELKAPQGIQLSSSEGKVEITWNADEYALSYTVYFGSHSGAATGNYDSSRNTRENRMELSSSDVVSGKKYFVAVRAFRDAIQSPYSEEKTIYASFAKIFPTHDGSILNQCSSGSVMQMVDEIKAGSYSGGVQNAKLKCPESRGYLKFDLSAIDQSNVVEAKLHLFHSSSFGGAVFSKVLVSGVGDYGTLDTADWNLSAINLNEFLPSQSGNEIDLTGKLGEGVNSFMLSAPSETQVYSFHSIEHSDSGLYPYLELRVNGE